MALQAVALQNTLSWRQTHTVTGYQTKSDAQASVNRINPTVSAGAANRVYMVQSTLAAGATVTINLFSVTEPVFGEALVPIRGYILKFLGTGSTWQFDTSAASPLVWFLAGTAPTLVGNAGDCFDYASATAITIDNTHKTFKITNSNGGVLVLTYSLEVIVGV